MKTDIISCSGCGVSIGGELESTLVVYRHQSLCSWCVRHWQDDEQVQKRPISFEEWTKGIKPVNSLVKESKRLRDAEIRKQYQAGKSKDQLIKDYHVGARTIHRALKNRVF